MAEGALPNKCDYCGLRVRYSFESAAATQGSDQAFAELRVLYERRVVSQKFSRVVGMTNIPGDFGSTEFCAVASKAWREHDKPCRYWSLKVDQATLADYLSIHQARRSHSQVLWVTFVALAVTAVLGIAQFVR